MICQLAMPVGHGPDTVGADVGSPAPKEVSMARVTEGGGGRKDEPPKRLTGIVHQVRDQRGFFATIRGLVGGSNSGLKFWRNQSCKGHIQRRVRGMTAMDAAMWPSRC